jgi:hypothetical protein
MKADTNFARKVSTDFADWLKAIALAETLARFFMGTIYARWNG